MSTKKYNVIKSLENDAPFSALNFCTISFLTLNNIDKVKHFDIYGLKVYNGYTSQETADNDAKKVKAINNKHDLFVAEIGKIYNWDDSTKSEEIEYQDKKLNDLEKTRREHADKAKILEHQLQNEAKLKQSKNENYRVDRVTKRLQERLLERGCITKQEYDISNSTLLKSKTVSNEKDIDCIDNEIEEASKVDYLDENTPTGLKYGCITIYFPQKIRGLSNMCFKIRGLFETIDQLNSRVQDLTKIYPNDTIYTFEIGKWIPFTSEASMDAETLNKKLNYGMKTYLDVLEKEGQEFDKRKQFNKSQAEEKAANQKAKNNEMLSNNESKDDNNSTILDNLTVYNEKDRANIENMYNFLNNN